MKSEDECGNMINTNENTNDSNQSTKNKTKTKKQRKHTEEGLTSSRARALVENDLDDLKEEAEEFLKVVER